MVVGPVYRYRSKSNVGGVLSLIGGIFGTVQSVIVTIVLMSKILFLIADWSEFARANREASSSIREAVGNQIMVQELFLVVLTLMTIGLGIFSVILLVGGLKEVTEKLERRPDLAMNAGMVGGAYIMLLFIVGSLVYFLVTTAGKSGNQQYDNQLMAGTALELIISLGALAIVPFYLIVIGIVRSREIQS